MGTVRLRTANEMQAVADHDRDPAAHAGLFQRLIGLIQTPLTMDTIMLEVRRELSQRGGVSVGDEIVVQTSFAMGASAGTSIAAARADHSHGTPLDPVPSHAALTSGVHGLGTASQVDVPLTGDASATQAVLGSDSRLGSCSWGSITGTLSAQTDLQGALDAKANLTANTFAGGQTVELGSGALPAQVSAAFSFRVAAADAVSASDERLGWGTSAFVQIARIAGGTRNTPLYPTNGQIFWSVQGYGYDEATASYLGPGSASTRILMLTTEAWNATSRGSGYVITGTRNGQTGQQSSFYLQGGALDPCLTLGIGAAPTTGNGLLQLAIGTTKAYGVAFGTDTFLYRSAAGILSTDGSFNVQSGQKYKVNGLDLALEDMRTPSDVATNNATTSAHGLCPKLSNVATEFLNGVGAFATPAGGGGGGGWAKSSVVTLSADQTTNLTAGSPIRFNTISGSHTLSNYRVKIKGGEKAYLQATIRPSVDAASTYANLQFYDVTNAAYVGLGSGWLPVNYNVNTNIVQPFALVSPSVDTEYELRVTATNGTVTTIQSGFSAVLVFSTGANGVVFSGTADKTVANTTSETSLIPTGVGSATLAADSFSAGRVLKIRLAGKYSSKGTPAGNITLKIKLGSTVVNASAAHAVDAGETDQFWRMEVCITCRATGATGTVIGQTAWEHTALNAGNTGMEVAQMVATGVVTINTTTSLAVDATAQWSAADASNTITTTCCQIEWLN